MSYCRWSSNNYGCDIYAYESANGYEVHVASNRVVGDIPKTNIRLLMDGGEAEQKEYVAQSKAQSEFLETATRKKIGLSCDGESYTLTTLEEFRDKLIELRKEGYIFPDYVFEDIRFEIEHRDDLKPKIK